MCRPAPRAPEAHRQPRSCRHQRPWRWRRVPRRAPRTSADCSRVDRQSARSCNGVEREDFVKSSPCPHHTWQELLRADAVHHGVKGELVDQEIGKRTPKTAMPEICGNRSIGCRFERTTMMLDETVRFLRAHVRRKHEAEKLGEVALRRAQRRQLPVVGAEAEPVSFLAECYVARTEIVMD